MPKLLPLSFARLAFAAGALCLPACGANPDQLMEQIRARLDPGQKTKVAKPKPKARPHAKKPSAEPQAEKTPAKPGTPEAVALKKLPLGPVPSLAFKARFTSSYDEAVADAQKSNRKILLILTGEHCDPCHDMRDHVFPQPQVRKALGPYVVLADKTGITFSNELESDVDIGPMWDAICDPDGSASVPTLAVFDENGKMLKKTVGWMDAEGVLAFLKGAAR